MIQEVLGSMGGGGRITGPMDESAGGRTMSDTTTIFILDTYQVSSLFIISSYHHHHHHHHHHHCYHHYHYHLNTADLPGVELII